MVADFNKYDKNYKEIPTYSMDAGDSTSVILSKLNNIPYRVVRNTTINGASVETWLIERWQASVGPDHLDERVFISFIDKKMAGWDHSGDISYIHQVTQRQKITEEKEQADTSGTGFVVSEAGHFLTNSHVVTNCTSIALKIGGKSYDGSLIASDPNTDLAIVETEFKTPIFATFKLGASAALGSNVVVVGFPLQSVLAKSMNVTTGVVSSTAGINDDFRLLQITAPVQQGNSGGPVFNEYGQVIGVVVSKINALRVASITGDIPQNINFAIKAGVARLFAEEQSIEFRTSVSNEKLNTEAVAELGGKMTAKIECNKS